MALLCIIAATPASAFVSTAKFGDYRASVHIRSRPHGPPMKRLVMCGGTAHGILHTAAAIGAQLPDTPLTTNLGVVSPVLLHQVLFLASNVAYFVAGISVLRTRQAPKTLMGIALMLVGVASTIFHSSQILMPVGSPVTKLFCSLDTVLATSQFVFFGSMCRQAVLRPSPRFLIGWPLAFLFYAASGGCYTLTHALWHLTTAYLAYSIVEDRDALLAPSSHRPPSSPALPKRGVQMLSVTARKMLTPRLQAMARKWGKLKRIAWI